MLLGERQKVSASLEASQELRLLPWSDDGQAGSQRREGELEAYLVVSFPRRAVRQGPRPHVQSDLDLTLGDDRTGESGPEEVAVFVHGVAGDGRKDEVRDELPLQIFDEDLVGAGAASALGDLLEILLLADIRDVGDDLVASIDQRLQDARGVEAAAVCENDFVGVQFRLRSQIEKRGPDAPIT